MKSQTQFLLTVCFMAQLANGGPQVQGVDVAGVWEGTLHVFGQNIPLVFRISLNRDGTLTAFHDTPDYTLFNVPVGEATLSGDKLILKIALYNGVYEGTVGNGEIRGRYSGSPGLCFPLVLNRESSDPQFLMEHMVPRLNGSGKRDIEYRYSVPRKGEDGWEVADACATGLDTSKLSDLVRRILAGEFPNLHSVLLVKDGRIVLDEYFHGFNRDKPHRLSSVGKVITAATVGIAVEKGMIKDVHTPLSQFFPEYGDLLAKDEKNSITLYHLLTMTTGLKWDEHSTSYFDPQNDLAVMKRSPDPLRNLFERPLAYRPGEQFVYTTGAMIALEEIVQRSSKAHFLLLAQNEIFTPMEIGNYRWDPSEGYYLVPRDMAKLGWLYLSRGEYQGVRILSTAWVDSALQRFGQPRPKYFNHWTPMVFFVEGTPMRAFQAGGWGGQSITIFPTLNTVIVMTAANQLQPADYDICIREYLLPAILTPRYRSTHMGIEENIHQTKNLEWEPRWNTEMGCLKASAKSLGLAIPESWLYGASGVGFLINVDETAAPKSMEVWNKNGAYDLLRNLGLHVDAIWSHTSNKDFSPTQKLVWDRVRKTIDSGYVCYGFHFEDPIRYLVLGYDSIAYYYEGWGAEKGEGPVFWYDLGRTTIGLLGMHFVRPVKSDVTFQEAVKKAFQFVLEFSSNSRTWVPADCKAGPEGYTRWISLLEKEQEDHYGASYNAVELAEGRRFAVQFLEDAKSRLGPELAPFFDRAMHQYRIVLSSLDTMCLIFPQNVLPAERESNLKDTQRRQTAIQYLRAAREAEIEGLQALKEIVERL